MQILWKAGALVLAVSLLGLAMCNAHRETLPATKAAPIVERPRDMAHSTTVLPASKFGDVVLPASKAGPLVPIQPAPQPQQQAAPK
jgi:hypothetical protein